MGSHEKPIILQCGDGGIKWATTLGDLGYVKDSQKSLTSLLRLNNYPGLFFSKIWSPQTKVGKNKDKTPIYGWDWKTAYFLKGGVGSRSRSFCESMGQTASYERGATRHTFDATESMLVLCPGYFRAMSLRSAARMQMEAEGYLDQLVTRSGIELHELMHITTNNISKC